MLYVIFHVVYYGTYTLIQEINYAQLNDIINNLTDFSYHDNFVSVIGDLNIRSEFGIDTSTKLMDIFKKLGVKSAFKCVTHNLDGQLDYVLMRNDIQSNKYLAGTFKNLYSDHRSLFLRIPLPEGEEEDDQEERQREREREEEEDQQVEVQYALGEVQVRAIGQAERDNMLRQFIP